MEIRGTLLRHCLTQARFVRGTGGGRPRDQVRSGRAEFVAAGRASDGLDPARPEQVVVPTSPSLRSAGAVVAMTSLASAMILVGLEVHVHPERAALTTASDTESPETADTYTALMDVAVSANVSAQQAAAGPATPRAARRRLVPEDALRPRLTNPCAAVWRVRPFRPVVRRVLLTCGGRSRGSARGPGTLPWGRAAQERAAQTRFEPRRRGGR
jgi:hypothetical protein